ncbi:hypothetical protein HPB47_020396, partial [Ixodes persulcatus]
MKRPLVFFGVLELRGHVEAILEKGERVGELAMSSSDILQVVMDNPGMSIFPSGFPEEDPEREALVQYPEKGLWWRNMTQSFARLPHYMCYTFNWKGSSSLDGFSKDPMLYEFNVIVLWYPDRSPKLT